MDKYLDSYKELISLRGLTDHTLKNYCTYIRAHLDFLTDILHKSPEDVSWDELRDYIRWLQKSMVTIMYSSGLRIGEVCRLRYKDVDCKNMRLYIPHTKNRSARYAILSKAALDRLAGVYHA